MSALIGAGWLLADPRSSSTLPGDAAAALQAGGSAQGPAAPQAAPETTSP
ncbi:hypothetical protein [Ideonella paludis]